MTERRVIVVFGATGAQGGSVLRALHDDKQFVVKAATRNPDSDKAKALTQLGVETVKVDMNDAGECVSALNGAYGVFLVTNFFDTMSKELEVKQAKNVLDAAKSNNVQHVVFSGLNSTKALIGKEAAHMESKVEIEQYIATLGLGCTVVRLAFYYENLLTVMKPQLTEQGNYVLAIPMADKPLDMVCVAEVGECVHQIFAKPEEFKGHNIGLSSNRATIDQYADILSKVLEPKKFASANMTTEVYGKLGFPCADDFAVMFECYQSGKCQFDVELTRRLNPNISTFEQWVARNKNAF